MFTKEAGKSPPPAKPYGDWVLKSRLYYSDFICYNKRTMSDKKRDYFSGFTLAEVLITLGIIGIVAALTMPVINKGKERKELEAGFK